MTTKQHYAGLNSDNWTNEPLKIIDQILQNFFSSLASQSNMFYGQVESFAFYMQKNHGDPVGLAQDIKQALVKLFSTYFSNINIDVKAIEATGTKREIQIAGTMEDTSAQVFDLGRVVQLNNLNITQILRLHNTGQS